MPGIVGFVSKMPREEAVPHLFRMVSALRHESFYSAGTWVDESTGVYVGWVTRRGSSSDGILPLRNERGNVVLVFSGEEYPDPSTRAHLKALGHNCSEDGPDYLVHLYEEDKSFPRKLNGRFHGLLVDRSRRRIMLFNDRYGMHRLYYHQSPDTFYFSAEAKAILAVRPELRKPNWQGLAEFVSCSAALENRTIFKDIHVLPPASIWALRAGSTPERSLYFDRREWEEQEVLAPEPYYEALRDTFTRNLPRYFSGRERIGMSLTAGLDTRMVVACANAKPGTLPCYTFGSMFRENQDVRNAKRVARESGQNYEVLTAGKDFLANFPHYAERAIFLTDGCVDVSRAPDLYLNEQAREIAPVRMTGLYGGEVLRGVRAFKPVTPAHGLFSKEFLTEIGQTCDTYERFARCHPVSFAAFMQNPWYLHGPLSLEQTQLQVRSPFLDNDFLQTVFCSPEAELRSGRVSWRLVADGNAALMRIPTDRGLTGEGGGLLEAMRHGLLEFSFKAEYAYDMGMPQWLASLDHAFSHLHLERVFLGRHKPFHFRVWYRDELAEYARGVLLDLRSLSRPYIERKGVEAIVCGHLKGNRNHTAELHKLLSLELIHRLFLDSDSSNISSREHLALEVCSH